MRWYRPTLIFGGGAGADPTAEIEAAIAAHVALEDPHTQYALETVAVVAAATLDTDNCIVRADGTGRGVQKSLATISDTGEIATNGTTLGYIDIYDDAPSSPKRWRWQGAEAFTDDITCVLPSDALLPLQNLQMKPDGSGLWGSGGYTTTATAAGTTTLTVASNPLQFFTGSTTQTVTLPVTSTLALGFTFDIVNNSTGIVTINSSGANAVLLLHGGRQARVTCILTSGTTAASWDVKVTGALYPGKIRTLKSAGSYTVGTVADEPYGLTLYVTSTGTVTLPAVADGMCVRVITVGAIAVHVDPNASDLIYLNGTALSDGDKISNTSTSGDEAILTYYDSTGWYAIAPGWTDGN